jgi:hypothetical protein
LTFEIASRGILGRLTTVEEVEADLGMPGRPWAGECLCVKRIDNKNMVVKSNLILKK